MTLVGVSGETVSCRGTHEDTSSDHVRISVGDRVLCVEWVFVPEEEVWEALERVGAALSVAVNASTALSRLGFEATSRLEVDGLSMVSSSRANLTVFLGVGGVVVGSSSRAKRTVFLSGVVSDMLVG